MIPGLLRPLSLCALAALALPLDALAQRSLGIEFQVNSYTSDNQNFASVATDADGDFVVAWHSNLQDGALNGIFAQRFSSDGAPLASEFQVNTYTTISESTPSVAIDAVGNFVVAWSGTDESSFGIKASRFSSAGTLLASEFLVNTHTLSGQLAPSVAMDADGDFVVAWDSSHDGSAVGIFGRRFSSAGEALASEFQVNTLTVSYQRDASVAADADGDFVVAWHGSQDGSGFGVFAQRFSSDGDPVASEFQVNSYTGGYQTYPSVAASASGDFVIAWSDQGLDGSGYGGFARRFTSAGVALASQFQVNAYTSNSQQFTAVAAAPNGDFVVSWDSLGQDGSAYGIFARRFSSAGAPLTTDFQVNTYTSQGQRRPTVALDADGDFVVAWQSITQDGSIDGVFAQRFAALATLDIDGNGVTEPLTDGLLVVRRLFTFSDLTLTAGAVGDGCTRCNAAAIQSYIAGLGLVLDIDDDKALNPLNDGILILRFLFTFSGTNLTANAVGEDCERCDHTVIEPYLAGLVD